jgi:hypothetical protein
MGDAAGEYDEELADYEEQEEETSTKAPEADST